MSVATLAGRTVPTLGSLPELAPDVLALQTGKEEPDYPFDHLVPRKGLYTLLDRPVFMAGRWNEETWTVPQIAEMERVFPLTVRDLHPWVTVNHEPPEMAQIRLEGDKKEEFKTASGLKLFLGFISRLYRNDRPYKNSDGMVIPAGSLLLAKFVNLAPNLALAISRGNFLRASVGVLEDAEIMGRVWPLLVEHCSFEGEWEAVTSLDDANRWYARASGKGSGKRRVVTFSKGVLTMEGQDTDLATRVSSLEAGQAQMLQMLQGIAAKLDAIAPPADELKNKEKEEKVEMGAGDESEDKTAANPTPPVDPPPTPPPTPPTPPPPPATFSNKQAADAEQRIAERVRKQFAAQLEAQQKEIARLSRESGDRATETKAEKRKLFMAKVADRIEPLLQPLGEFIDEGLEELEATLPQDKRKLFHNATSKTSYGLHAAFRLFVSNRQPLLAGQGQTKLEDLHDPKFQAPEQGQQDWDGASTHQAIMRHKEAKKLATFSAARKEFLKTLPAPERHRFLAGEGKPAQLTG